MNQRRKKLIALALVLGMNYAGLSAVGRTVAYFNDTETSVENFFSAAELDFTALPSSFEYEIAAGEQVHFSVTLDKASSTTPFGQRGRFEWLAVEDRTLCSAMELILVASSSELYRGPLPDFSYDTTSLSGIFEFQIIATTTGSAVLSGEKCGFNFVFDAGQTPELSGGGFSDTEKVGVTLTAAVRKGVVLNEFLPNPTGLDSADMPDGEWIELYNNGDTPRDLSGWYTRDSTDGEGNRVFVTASNTLSATTTIAAHGWLVVYMNKAILNNGGDTVRLFDSSGNLVDSHSYGTAPENKSFARIPDGVGEWVDPIPTPGEPNLLDEIIVADTADIETATPAEVFATSTKVLETSNDATTTAEIIVVPEVPAGMEESVAESPTVIPAEETEAIDEPIMYREETSRVISEETWEPKN